MAVMQAESGCNPTADNTGLNTDGSNDKGLFQINSIHVTSGLVSDAGRFNPEQNIKAAYAIYRGGGWSAWSAYNNGGYLKFL
jgi:soluble lytic murein transglycosylase-like protein